MQDNGHLSMTCGFLDTVWYNNDFSHNVCVCSKTTCKCFPRSPRSHKQASKTGCLLQHKSIGMRRLPFKSSSIHTSDRSWVCKICCLGVSLPFNPAHVRYPMPNVLAAPTRIPPRKVLVLQVPVLEELSCFVTTGIMAEHRNGTGGGSARLPDGLGKHARPKQCHDTNNRIYPQMVVHQLCGVFKSGWSGSNWQWPWWWWWWW